MSANQKMEQGMGRDALLERVARVVREAMVADDKSLREETHFIRDLEAESLDLVCIATGLEEEFGQTIDEDDFQDLMTIGAVLDYIEAEQRKQERVSA